MKKVFTLVLAMTIVITSFAQVRSLSSRSALTEVEQTYTLSGFEERDYANVPLNPRGMMAIPDDTDTELAFTAYDWQSNAAQRNFTAVWPDGFAVMCYTLATTTSYSDRGTGLAWFDPAVGEWQFNELRAEDEKTGFGSIARYKENGLVIAAHTATELKIYIVEDFRSDPTQSFGTGTVLEMTTAGVDGTHPAVQCSGENLDIIHVLAANFQNQEPFYNEAIFYWRYQNGAFDRTCELLPSLDADHVADGGTNTYFFADYDPAKPNRVAFVVNTPWSDGKAVVSDDNGETWTDRIFYQHPGIHETYTSDQLAFYYPRWTDVAFDNDDNLHVVYAFNGANGAAGGDGGYYPGVGGIGYWSEVLPKNELCVGGIGEVGEPFIMDTTYISQDIYGSSPYWSDQTHDPLPEYIGDLVIVDDDGHVLGWDATEGNFPSNTDLSWAEHGKYNSGRIDFCTMHYDRATNRVFAFWSMIAGDAPTEMYVDNNLYFYRIFGNVSMDGGRTWEGTFQVFTDIMFSITEMAYPQVIPYVYNDEEGDYLWLCYQNDGQAGTYVQSDEAEPDDNFYHAAKVYVNYMWDDVEENNVEAPTHMTVYPNPAQGTFTLELNQESDVNVFNAVGQLVQTYKSVKNLSLSLEAGIYFVQAGNQTQKVVVF